jgi:hypothetical protein
VALTKDFCDQLLKEINEALLEVDSLKLCANILENYSNPWPGHVEGIVEYILFQIGEEGNSNLQLLLLPAY